MSIGESIAIGIDLGTYNSAATVLLGEEQPVMLKAREGVTEQGVCFPSFVEFDERGEFLRAGEYARRALPVTPERIVWGVKRLIGKSYDEVKRSGDLERFQYKVSEGRDGSCRIKVGAREYSPTEISSLVLKKIKDDAEAGFNPIGCPVTEATITVPAYFGPLQRAETEQAARMAGFDKVRLIPEPTAAALAYKVRVEQQNQYIAVMDLGAGTLDVTVALLYLNNDALQTAEKGHGGDTALGGIDIDDAILQHVVKTHDLRRVMKDSHGRARLRAEVERAKIELSDALEAKVAFSSSGGNVSFVLRREEVEAAVSPVIGRCVGPIKVALTEANLNTSDLSHVLLVGGPAKMPLIRRMVANVFADNPAVKREVGAIGEQGFPVDPMEAVARGAVLGGFGGITPHAYGVTFEGAYYALVPRRTRYPCTNSASWLVSSKKRWIVLNLIQSAIDPQGSQEVYTMLGVFQFDYRPEPGGQTSIQLDAEYTENGVLNLHIFQPSSMVRLPLYSVSKLEGRKISKPQTALPIGPPQYTISEGPSGGGPPAPPPSEQWSRDELDQAIRSGRRLLDIARARLSHASSQDRARLEELIGELSQAINNTWEDIGTRAPQVRNLNRSLMIAMVACRLLKADEQQELLKGIG